jgi:hypothetical protein
MSDSTSCKQEFYSDLVNIYKTFLLQSTKFQGTTIDLRCKVGAQQSGTLYFYSDFQWNSTSRGLQVGNEYYHIQELIRHNCLNLALFLQKLCIA